MTKTEAVELIRHLRMVFDVVRLVDTGAGVQYSLDSREEPAAEPCCALWGRRERCENCIAARAAAQKGKLSKFEFTGGEVYHVTVMYLEVEETPLVLEMALRVTDDALLSARGQSQVAEAINGYNRRLYLDALTGAYNRRYYEDQMAALGTSRAAAILDVDDFKQINDTYGHPVGDMALKAIVEATLSCVRSTDIVIRYGGDEFLILFQSIPKDTFAARLETIRAAVRSIVLEEQPELRLSVSIGGIYRDRDDMDLLRKADELLYRAKEEKNAVRWE